MSDIFEEALRDHGDEKKLKYLRQALPYVIILTILVIILMACFDWYKNKNVNYNQKMGDLFIKSLENAGINPALSDETLQHLKKDSKNNLNQLASLEQVGLKIINKDLHSAKKLLEEIINNNSYYGVTRSYAKLLWLSIIIDQKELSENETKQINNYLQDFEHEKREFFGTANIIKAIWLARNNEVQKAQQSLKAVISSEYTPDSVKDQAKALLTSIENK